MTTDTVVIHERHETEDGSSYHRFYADVTEQARLLFGDVVVSARQVVLDLNLRYEDDQSQEEARYNAQHLLAEHDENGMEVNAGHEMYILFASGATVCFHTSEWGSICVARKNKATA